MCALPQDKYTNLFLGFGLEDQGCFSLKLMYTQTKNKFCLFFVPLIIANITLFAGQVYQPVSGLWPRGPGLFQPGADVQLREGLVRPGQPVRALCAGGARRVQGRGENQGRRWGPVSSWCMRALPKSGLMLCRSSATRRGRQLRELRSILAASNQSRAHIDLSSACLSPHTTRCVQALMINAVNCCAGGKVTRDAGPVKGATSEIAFIEVRACGRCCIAVTQNSLLSCLQSQYAVLGPECCCPMLLCLS